MHDVFVSSIVNGGKFIFINRGNLNYTIVAQCGGSVPLSWGGGSLSSLFGKNINLERGKAISTVLGRIERRIGHYAYLQRVGVLVGILQTRQTSYYTCLNLRNDSISIL